VQTYLENSSGDDLVFLLTTVTSVVYSDGNLGASDSIIGATVTLTGAKRDPVGTPGTTFTPATISISNGTTTYFTATLMNTVTNNIEFELIDGLWRLNPYLDVNNLPTLNLENILLNPGPIPSDYILDLQAKLGGGSIAGMTMTLNVFSGDITTDSFSEIFEGIIDGVPAVVPNTPPTADAGATTSSSTCLANTCVVTLNGSQSTDADSTPGTNDDIVTFEWFEYDVLIATGEIAPVSLSLGMHDITLKVTDSAGDTDEATITIVIDPAELSFIDINTAYVKHNGLVKITGKVALPAGVSYLDINSVGSAAIGISSLGNVIDESVDFTEFRNGSKWKYNGDPLFGIERFKIDWSGARFSYQDPLYNLKMKTLHIGESETSLQIKSCAAVTIDINGVTVDIDRTRTDRSNRVTCSHASARLDRDNDGEDDDRDDDHGDKDDDDHNSNCTTNVTLPFALSPEMVISITHGTVTDTISVADYYTAAVGKYTITGRFDATGIDFSSLDPNLSLTVALGDEGFYGTVVIDQSTWTKIRSNQWKYDPH